MQQNKSTLSGQAQSNHSNVTRLFAALLPVEKLNIFLFYVDENRYDFTRLKNISYNSCAIARLQLKQSSTDLGYFPHSQNFKNFENLLFQQFQIRKDRLNPFEFLTLAILRFEIL